MNTKTTKAIVGAVVGMSLMAGAVMAQQVDLTKPADMNKRAEELKNLKWGMFICWSFSTFSGQEWTGGVKDVSFFKATGCDTDQWARTAKEAGMGYILFLAKHHDGFCLWDTKTTDRKVTKSPLGRDVLAELRKSCDKYGIKLALYFSEGDWSWPGAKDGQLYGSGQEANKEKAQLIELLTNYGPIEYMWVDHAAGTGGLSHQEFLAHCKALQPGCFVGFNHGDQTGVRIRLGEMGKPGPLDDHKAAGPHMQDAPSKDYLLAEFTYPILPPHKGGAMWFYSLPKHDNLCLPAKKLYKDYLGAVKYGNIFSIDVGPNYAGRLRDIDVKTLREVGEMIRNPPSTLMAKPPKDKWKAELLKQPIRAFCVDFNWEVKGKFCFAAPGHWADADPAAQVKWCKDAGVNCIQTFILSANGHAWYKGGPIPEQPGLKHDFLTEVAKQGHQQKMLVMGYYCISANSLWGKNHPDQSYGTPSGGHIPLTKDYVEYLCRSVRDVLKRTEIDGFMLDWMSNTSGKWLDCEKTMYAELMGVPFPGADKVTAADKAAFDQKAVERCWTSIRDAARGVKPDCILWPNFLHHLSLEGVDWLLNEGPDPRETEAAEQRLGGRPVRLIQNQVGWPNHDARKVFSKSKYNTWDFYGFAAPYDNGLPLPVADYLGKPIDEFKGTDRMAINDKNIAALVRFYLGKPVEPAASETALSCGKPATASSTWGAGLEADKAVDGNDESRWGAAPDTRSGWLEVDLGKNTEVGLAVIKELSHNRTEAFSVECKEGDNWKELVKGKTIMGEKVFRFTPVTARYFRLNIQKANEVPTIEEFQLFAPGTKVAVTPEKPRDPKLKWFDEAKYGLFINWGLYSIPAGEWKGKKYPNIGEWIMYDAKIPVKEYEELAKQFNPQKFNAEEWAQLAEDAGMKYLVFDCKHHDGFALYRSEASKYNCFDATPWRRDPFKELQEACQKRGIKLCFYYSQATDWHEPNGAVNNWDFKPDAEKDFDQYLRDKSMPQVTELLKNYGPIGLIWFDVPELMTPERSKKLADLVRSIQPGTLINSRLGQGNFHDYQSMGDNEIPNRIIHGAWETAATINDTWGYKTDDHNWKQPDNITFKLVDIVSKGGNYLLNVGPDGDGYIPQPSQDILRKVGKWLKVNGDAVYGAGKTPFGDELAKPDWRCTVKPFDWTPGKPGKIYVHFFKWPGAKFELAGFNGQVEKAYMLADTDRKPLKCSVTENELSVELPEKATDEIDSVLCIEVKD